MKIIFAIIVLILCTVVAVYSQYSNNIGLQSNNVYNQNNINQLESKKDTLIISNSSIDDNELLKQRYINEDINPVCNPGENSSNREGIIYRKEKKVIKVYLINANNPN